MIIDLVVGSLIKKKAILLTQLHCKAVGVIYSPVNTVGIMNLVLIVERIQVWIGKISRWNCQRKNSFIMGPLHLQQVFVTGKKHFFSIGLKRPKGNGLLVVVMKMRPEVLEGIVMTAI
jgi:hypothetical protein